jgi:hypothetical protein
LPTVVGALVGVCGEKARHLGLDRLRQQGAGAAAQNFGQRIDKGPWLDEGENISRLLKKAFCEAAGM